MAKKAKRPRKLSDFRRVNLVVRFTRRGMKIESAEWTENLGEGCYVHNPLPVAARREMQSLLSSVLLSGKATSCAPSALWLLR